MSAPWVSAAVMVALIVLAVPLGYLLYRVRKPEDAGRSSPSPRSWLLIIVFGLFILSAIGRFFSKLPSRQQLENQLNASHENGTK